MFTNNQKYLANGKLLKESDNYYNYVSILPQQQIKLLNGNTPSRYDLMRVSSSNNSASVCLACAQAFGCVFLSNPEGIWKATEIIINSSGITASVLCFGLGYTNNDISPTDYTCDYSLSSYLTPSAANPDSSRGAFTLTINNPTSSNITFNLISVFQGYSGTSCILLAEFKLPADKTLAPGESVVYTLSHNEITTE